MPSFAESEITNWCVPGSQIATAALAAPPSPPGISAPLGDTTDHAISHGYSSAVMFTVRVTQFSSGYGGAGGGGSGLVVLLSSWWCTYSSSFGEPSPGFCTAPLVAASSSAVVTWSGVGIGCVAFVAETAAIETSPQIELPKPAVSATADDRYAAAAPATCGHAIEVPLMVRVASSSPIQADFTSEPGAKISTHSP